jgi:hypothetical protein
MGWVYYVTTQSTPSFGLGCLLSSLGWVGLGWVEKKPNPTASLDIIKINKPAGRNLILPGIRIFSGW